MMDSQDFEAYAQLKPINSNVADTWKVVLDEAKEMLDKPWHSMRILDYGCGDGKYFDWLVSLGVGTENIYGLEVSTLRLERCWAKGWENAHMLVKGENLPFDDASFDLINFMEVIEHIPRNNVKQVVDELRRVLKPGGVMLISTPNYPVKRFYDIVDAVMGGKWDRLKDDPTHVSFYNHTRLHTVLDTLFCHVEERIFKPGFLYKRFPRPFFLHKLFFLCQA